jgi:ParB/RepB/Spo0J family partition protein
MASKLQERLAKKTAGIERPADDAGRDKSGDGLPMTMPGQLGAFRLEAQRYQDTINALTERVKQAENSGPDTERNISLDLIDDSPYQPRIEYDPEEIDELAHTMESAGQADPIKVRQVENRFELISGHRRTRAAQSLGWTTINAIIELRTDKEAEVEAMLLLVANVGLSDFEFAKMCARAFAQGYVKTQTDAARFFGCKQSKISGCLDLLKMPPAILEMLERRPSMFGVTCGKWIKDMVTDSPAHLDIIVKGVQMLNDGMAQTSLKGWVAQKITQINSSSHRNFNQKTITTGRRTIYATKVEPRKIIVSLKSPQMTMEYFEERLNAWLEQEASTFAAINPAIDKT